MGKIFSFVRAKNSCMYAMYKQNISVLKKAPLLIHPLMLPACHQASQFASHGGHSQRAKTHQAEYTETEVILRLSHL